MSTTAKTTQKQETQELADFSWDNSEKFFEIEPVETKETTFEDEDAPDNSTETDLETEKETTEEDKEGSTETKEKKVTKTKKKEEAPEPFSETETASETEAEDEDEDVKFYTTLAHELKEKNIFQTVEITKDSKITEEQFFELQDAEIENRVEETINAFIEELKEDDGAAFLNFKKAGGKTRDFFAVYAQSSEIPEVDLKDKASQEAFLRYYYRTYEDLDPEDIEDKLEWLEETGKRVKIVEKYNSKVTELDKARKAELQKKAEADQQKREDNKKLFINEVKTTLETAEQLGAFTVSKTDKKELADYIVKPTVKLQNGTYTTKLQSDLNSVFASKDRTKLLLLAKLLKNDFDVSDLIKGVKTEVTKQTKSTLQSQKLGLRPASSNTAKNRLLADYFS